MWQGVTKGTSYESFRLGNVMPTRNLLTALQREHPDTKRFVLGVVIDVVRAICDRRASSRGRTPRGPIEHYGESKLEAERVVEEESGGVPWTIVRPSGVYGPGDVDSLHLFKSAQTGWNVFFGNRAPMHVV